MEGIHPLVKLAGIKHIGLPNVALKQIGRFISSPACDEIRALKGKYIEKKFITGVSRRIMPSINRSNISKLHKKLLSRKVCSFTENMKDMSLESMKEGLKDMYRVTKTYGVEERFIPFRFSRYDYQHGPILKVYKMRDYLLKKADLWLEMKFLEQLVGDRITDMYERLNYEIMLHIKYGTSWYNIVDGVLARYVDDDILISSIISVMGSDIQASKVRTILYKQLFDYCLFSKTLLWNDIMMRTLSVLRIINDPKYIKNHITVWTRDRLLNKKVVLEEAFRIFPEKKRSELRKMRKADLINMLGYHLLDVSNCKVKNIHYRHIKDDNLTKIENRGKNYKYNVKASNIEFIYRFFPKNIDERLWCSYFETMPIKVTPYEVSFVNKCYINIRKPYRNYMREFYMDRRDFISYVDAKIMNKTKKMIEEVKPL